MGGAIPPGSGASEPEPSAPPLADVQPWPKPSAPTLHVWQFVSVPWTPPYLHVLPLILQFCVAGLMSQANSPPPELVWHLQLQNVVFFRNDGFAKVTGVHARNRTSPKIPRTNFMTHLSTFGKQEKNPLRSRLTPSHTGCNDVLPWPACRLYDLTAWNLLSDQRGSADRLSPRPGFHPQDHDSKRLCWLFREPSRW